MHLTIMRHGEAGSATSDRLRQLTPRGHIEVTNGCGVLDDVLGTRALPPVSALYYSSWERTAQTAQIARGRLAPAVFEDSAALIPGSGIAAVDALLTPLMDVQAHVLLVSHQPLVSSLVQYYLGSSRVPGLWPGAWVCMDLAVASGNCAQLECWAMPPSFEVQA